MSRNQEEGDGQKAAEEAPKKPRSDEQVVSHSVNHPTRLDALSILYERMASPHEIQKELGIPLAAVSNHVKELYKDGVIEFVKGEPRRGAIEHFYRAKTVPEVTAEEWKKLPGVARRGIANLAMQAIVADGLASLRHRKFEADDNLYLAWMPMRLSRTGEDEGTELQAEILTRLKDITKRDEARRAESGEEVSSVRVVTTTWFERAQPGRPRREFP